MTNETEYDELQSQLGALVREEDDVLANTANFVGLLFHALRDINWLGVYVLRGPDLVLGPFQGKPACVRIPVGRGVCGTAFSQRKTLRVDDVHAFEGHIACDPDSRSEIVVPLILGKEPVGVLDIDSPSKNRFSDSDQQGIETLCAEFMALLTWKKTTSFI